MSNWEGNKGGENGKATVAPNAPKLCQSIRNEGEDRGRFGTRGKNCKGTDEGTKRYEIFINLGDCGAKTHP